MLLRMEPMRLREGKHMEEIKRTCPNGWECTDCQHESFCAIGQYYVEPEITIIEIAAKVEKAVVQEASRDARNIKRGTWASQFLSMNTEQRWKEYGKWPTPHLHYKEPIPLDGLSSPGGGGSKNAKKNNKGCKPTQYKWNEFK